MSIDGANKVGQTLRKAALRGASADLSDGQLLDQFVDRRDESAFEALVRRHGPMVLGVCRRVLRGGADADDAFQAVFLVLVRKASSIRRRELVGSWLYTVAYQTALRARQSAARRQSRERQVTEMPEPIASDRDPWGDVLPLLDRELSRLPELYRIPIILCELEGKTHKDAARRLGCPEGTVSARLSRAKAMLARRLARHGLAVTAGVLAAALSRGAARAAVPPLLTKTTVMAGVVVAGGGATVGIISAKTAALTNAVLQTLFLNKLRGAGTALLAAALITFGAGAVAYRAFASDPPRPDQPPSPAAAARASPADGGESDAPRDGARYRIINAAAGRCLSVWIPVNHDAHIALGPLPRDAGSFEEWKLSKIGDNFHLVNARSGLAMSVPPDAVDQEGATMLQRESQRDQKPAPPGQDPPRFRIGGLFPELRIEDQLWRLVKNGKHYSLQTYLGDRLALGVEAGHDPPLVVQRPFVPGRPDQIWILQRVDDPKP